MDYESTTLECMRDDLQQCDYLSYTRFFGRSIPGVPLVSPSGIHAAWISISKFPTRDWFDITFHGVREFVFLGLDDVAIFVLSDGSYFRFPFLQAAGGSDIRFNSIPVREDLMAHLVQVKIDRVVFGRVKTMEQRPFSFELEGDLMFRWMVYRIWFESQLRGWVTMPENTRRFDDEN